MKNIFKVIPILIIILLVSACTNNVQKEIKNIDKNLKYEEPLGIDSIKLMKNGDVIIVPNDETIAKEQKTIISDVKDMYIFTFGNSGYRTILFIKNNGSISAVNASELIQNKKIEILNNLGNYSGIISIKQDNDQEGRIIYAINKNNKEYMLDEYIK